MSRVIAFDIAAVAQKVKVVNEDRCDLFGGGSLVRNRKGSKSNRKDADLQRNAVTLCQIALKGSFGRKCFPSKIRNAICDVAFILG